MIPKSYTIHMPRKFLWNHYLLSNFCFVKCHLTGQCLPSQNLASFVHLLVLWSGDYGCNLPWSDKSSTDFPLLLFLCSNPVDSNRTLLLLKSQIADMPILNTWNNYFIADICVYCPTDWRTMTSPTTRANIDRFLVHTLLILQSELSKVYIIDLKELEW